MNDTTRDAFEDWAVSKSIDITKSKDAWGNDIYQHPHVDSMWFGWQAATEQGKPQWLPIESAPKEGSVLINSTLKGVFEGFWQPVWYEDRCLSGWLGANLDEEYGEFIYDVTHWMPLPAPPQGKI